MCPEPLFFHYFNLNFFFFKLFVLFFFSFYLHRNWVGCLSAGRVRGKAGWVRGMKDEAPGMRCDARDEERGMRCKGWVVKIRVHHPVLCTASSHKFVIFM